MKNLILTLILLFSILTFSQNGFGNIQPYVHEGYEQNVVAEYNGTMVLEGVYQDYLFQFTAKCDYDSYRGPKSSRNPRDERKYYHTTISMYYFSPQKREFVLMKDFVFNNQPNKYYNEHLDHARLYLINEVLKIKP